MFSLNEAHRFYLYSGVCDMRKGFDTLCGVVRLHMGRDPLSGEVFIFLNRVRTTVKLLHWEHGGLVIYHKRLEQGRFSPPRYNEKTGSVELKWVDLVMMIEGIKVEKTQRQKRYEKPSKTL